MALNDGHAKDFRGTDDIVAVVRSFLSVRLMTLPGSKVDQDAMLAEAI
jgi:hypothetical protein